MVKETLDAKMFTRTQEIINHLDDDISLDLFDLRTMFSIGKLSRKDLIEENKKMFDDWRIPELDSIKNEITSKNICIFGAGNLGYLTYITLKSCHAFDDYCIIFADNNTNLWGTQYMGCPVIKPDDLKSEHFSGIVIIANELAFSEIYHQLLFLVDRKQIFVPANAFLIARRGIQYFDYFQKSENNQETYVDCGCYDGNDIIQYANWCKGNYKKIYGFEPNKFDCDITRKNLLEHNIRNFELFNCAVDKKQGEISFSGDGYIMGHVDALSIKKVRCDSIDGCINDDVSFIKMDIEGAELAAIEGAKETIRKYKPRLAICIYHKNEDPWTIPTAILDINPSYHLAIRQYWMWPEECVLYAY